MVSVSERVKEACRYCRKRAVFRPQIIEMRELLLDPDVRRRTVFKSIDEVLNAYAIWALTHLYSKSSDLINEEDKVVVKAGLMNIANQKGLAK